MKESFVETNGVKLHVVEAGPENGPLLIFLHGFPEFWRSWINQIEHFANLGYRVLVPDQRGYNLSDKPQGIPNYSVEKLSADVVGLINWAGREKAYIVGHDWGAAVAWWTALQFPQRVEKLVILNVPHPLVMKKNLVSNLKQLRKSWYIFFFQLPKIPEWLLSRRNLSKLSASLVKTSLPGTFKAEELEEYQKAWRQKGALTGMLGWYRAALQKAPRLPNKQVHMPTLILWGTRDAFLGKEMATQSLKYCEQGKLELFNDATHWVQHEKPERVNAKMHAFFQNS